MQDTVIRSGSLWLDTEGNSIQAHGGGILFHKGVYYWYGENKNADNVKGLDDQVAERVDVIGVSCYSSCDLYHWKHEGIVLPAVLDDELHDLHTSKVLERPKVIYNSVTEQFVMFMHIDRMDYEYARVGIAVSERPTGPFRYLKSLQPNGFDSRDMTVFADDDGKAYLITTSEWNSCTIVHQLTADYQDVEPIFTKHFKMPNPHESREAQALFKINSKYYMISSGCTGWGSNAAEYAVADSIHGPWVVMGNPCVGEGANLTFNSQSTFVLPVAGAEDAFIFMADRWERYSLKDSSYVWLPIRFEGEKLVIEWRDEWNVRKLMA